MIAWKYEKAQVILHRLVALACIFFLIFVILVLRLCYLQIFQGEKFKLLADKNRISVRATLPIRGTIYDRNGIKLAENKKNFRAIFIREGIKNYKKVLDKFSLLVSLSTEERSHIEKELKKMRPFMPVMLKDNLSYQEIAALSLNAPDLPGIQLEEGLTRVYPFAENTAHVLGYLSIPSEDDLKENELLSTLTGYKIGSTGMEKVLENHLMGTPGLLKSEINAYGRTVRILEKVPPLAGENIMLTLDARLQQYGLDVFGEQAGSAIVMDIHTGEILMLISAPSFDPNLFLMPVSSKDWTALNTNKKKPLTNKALSGTYSQGSIFKIVVALAGLESGDIKLNEKEYCSGKVKLGQRTFHCWKEHGHGNLDVIGALRESCDVFFYKKAQEIGVDKIVETAHKLGFGELTGIELIGEKKGLLPSRQWKQAVKKDGWRMGDTFNLSIGQGFLSATPLQMLQAASIIAADGVKVQPHLLKTSTPFPVQEVPFKKDHLAIVRKGMNEVVNDPHGTAHRSAFNLDGLKMAGKTASTQVRGISLKERLEGVKKQEELPWEYRDHGMFVAFAPTDNPRYAAIVVVEHGGGGSKAAAPIASKLLKKVLQLEKGQN